MLSNNSQTSGTADIEVVARDGRHFVYLSGRLDIDSSPAIRERVLKLLQDSPHASVSIDLSAVTHTDSAGVATLIESLRIARENNARLTLQGLNERVLHFFELTGLLPLFNGGTEGNPESANRGR